MAINITVIGNGQVNQLSSSVNIYYPDAATFTDGFIGTGYQLSAIPANGWQFEKWEYEYDRQYAYRVSQGGGWIVSQTEHIGPYTDDTSDTLGPPEFHPDEGWWNNLVFDGFHFIMGSPGGSSAPGQRYYDYNWNISCYFKHPHEYTHLIVRDDTTGKIMRGGTQNKILRDD